MIVIDASAFSDVVLARPAAARIRERVERDDQHIHVPVTFDVEVLQTVRKYWLNGEADDQIGLIAIGLLRAASIQRHDLSPFLARIWELRRNNTAYDAGYVALAESLDIPLITRDARLARSSGHVARIEYIA